MKANLVILILFICLKKVVVSDCGQINPGEPLGLTENDGTGDKFPHHPEDTDIDFTNVSDHSVFFNI